MMRRILAIAVGLCACGDTKHTLTDASVDAPASGSDAAAADAPPPDAFVDTSLILRYDFEDSVSATKVADSSGRGKDGTLSDVAAWTTAGRTNHGIALAGGLPPALFVTFPDGVLAGVNDFTISAWVKPNTIANWIRIYDFGHGTPGTPDARWMFLTLHGFPPGLTTPDGLHASSFSAAGPSEIISASGTEIPVGIWKHVAVTGSGGVRTLYIDGYPVATATTALSVPPSDMEPTGGTSWIGKSRFAATDAGLDGTVDDFRIYNRVLMQGEIADLAWPQHDYSYWRFDETSGQTAKDSSDNAIPTALKTGPTWIAGRLGGALDFPGGPHNTDGPHAELAATPLANCTDQLTVATWVKLHSQDAWARIFDFGTGGNLFTFLTLFDDPGTGQHGMHFAMVSPGGIFDIATTTPPVPGDGTWHHVAVTVAPSKLVTMYVDGTSVASDMIKTGVKVSDFTATTENYLGKSRFVNTDPYLHAALDDLRISCRAFTADEIKNLSHP
jgi:hypothetical protein